jgi:glycosyltransferase involved in cell wall biosynthesis
VLEHFYPYIGGAEQLFWELATALAREGQEVGVVTTRFRPGLPQEEVLEGVKIYRVDCRNRYLFSFFSLPVILARLKEGYDLVHTTSYNAALPAWLASRIRRKPVIITFHEAWGKLWWQLPFANFFQRLAFYSWEQLLLRLPFRRFIAVSDFTRSELIRQGVKQEQVERIYNGLDYAAFEAYRHQPPLVFTYAYFGRLGMSKGLNLLLPAAREMAQAHPETRLKLIIPTYPEGMYRWVMSEINRLGLEEHIILLHDLPKGRLLEEISQSSCVVIPSYSEGFCFVAAEAAAMQVPIISSQRGALAEVVSGAYLPLAEMTAAALAAALRQAYAENWQGKPQQQFPLSKSVEAYLKLYERLLD